MSVCARVVCRAEQEGDVEGELTLTPMSRSTAKHVMPLYPSSGAAVAKTRNRSASIAFEIHILCPSITYFAPRFVALVRIANASLPDPCSDRQNEASVP